jgi:hypothetical protein
MDVTTLLIIVFVILLLGGGWPERPRPHAPFGGKASSWPS